MDSISIEISLRSMYKWLLVSVAFILITPLALAEDSKGENIQKFVSALSSPVTTENKKEAKVESEDLITLYEALAKRVTKGSNRVLFRVANLKLQEYQKRLLLEPEKLKEAEKELDEAIKIYITLLKDTKKNKSSEVILYSLARAYRYKGEKELSNNYLKKIISRNPRSILAAEVNFRLGESSFVDGEYAEAKKYYQKVLEAEITANVRKHATYMLAWTYFKELNFDRAAYYFSTLNNLILSDNKKVSSLSVDDEQLIKDSIRAFVSIFFYLADLEDGIALIEKNDTNLWNYELHDSIAQVFEDKERYLDAVRILEHFIDVNPYSIQAPKTFPRAIRLLQITNLKSKITFFENKFRDLYVLNKNTVTEKKVQQNKDKEATLAKLFANKENQKIFVDYWEKNAKSLHAKAQKNNNQRMYSKTSDAYNQLITTLSAINPEHKKLAYYLFLMGEAYTEAGLYTEAIQAHQHILTHFASSPFAKKANLILVSNFNRLLTDTKQDNELLKAKLAAENALLETVTDDKQALNTNLSKLSTQFSLKEYGDAVNTGKYILGKFKKYLNKIKEKTVHILIAQSYFYLQNYRSAEQHYSHAMKFMDPKTKLYRQTLEKKQASIYKQGSLFRETNPELTVMHFKRAYDLGKTKIGENALYDASLVAEQTKRKGLAIQLLELYAVNFKKPTVISREEMHKRLFSLYESTGYFAKAAKTLLEMNSYSKRDEVRRHTLLQAAYYYKKANENDLAIKYFQKYIDTYKKPLADILEATHQIDELNLLTLKDRYTFTKRLPLLKKKEKLFKAMGNEVTDRARYLAAEAAFIIATQKAEEFMSLKINQPLEHSFLKKEKSLLETIELFNHTEHYQVAQFNAASTYHIGKVYHNFMESLEVSERPKSLSISQKVEYEKLLEDQTKPMLQKSIEIFEINVKRAQDRIWNLWIEKSYSFLEKIAPLEYKRKFEESAFVL